MSNRLAYHLTAEDPDAKLWLEDADGTLLDLSSGYTFTLRIGRPGSAALVEKTSGMTGAAGSGVEPTGTPNMTITWDAGELAALTASRAYVWQLTGRRTGSRDRVWEGTFAALPVIT